MERNCWCCGEPLASYPERLDGICLSCGLDDFPALDITSEGRIAADLYREAETVVLLLLRPETEPPALPEPVW